MEELYFEVEFTTVLRLIDSLANNSKNPFCGDGDGAGEDFQF